MSSMSFIVVLSANFLCCLLGQVPPEKEIIVSFCLGLNKKIYKQRDINIQTQTKLAPVVKQLKSLSTYIFQS